VREDELERLLRELRAERPEMTAFINSHARDLALPPRGRLVRATRKKARTIAEHERKMDEAREAAAADPTNPDKTGLLQYYGKEIPHLRQEYLILEAVGRFLRAEGGETNG
jgi:hypothetical protein